MRRLCIASWCALWAHGSAHAQAEPSEDPARVQTATEAPEPEPEPADEASTEPGEEQPPALAAEPAPVVAPEPSEAAEPGPVDGPVGGALAVPATDAPPSVRRKRALRSQSVVLGGAGGYDFLTQQAFAGLDLAIHHDGATGFGFEGRVLGGVGIGDVRPLGRVEAGFTGVVPNKQGYLIRVGLIAGVQVAVAPYATLFQVPGPPEDPEGFGNPGFNPYGLFIAELGWRRPETDKGPATWSLGLKAGAGAVLREGPCDDNPELTCRDLQAAFLGGLAGRLHFHEGAYLEALAGPNPMLSIGYGF